jgi:hypothetical protein
VICLGVAAGLSTQRLVETAERMPLDQRRTVLLAGAERLHDLATTLELHQPDRLIRHLTGRPPFAGGDDPSTAAVAPDPGDELGSGRTSTTTTSTDGAATTAPPTTAPPTTAPPTTPPTTQPPTTQPPTTMRTVSSTEKLRLWAGGDSLGEYVGSQLLSPVANAELTEIVLDYHISTGLARPDYFDWQAQLATVMSQERPPEALVFMVGGNDDQNMAASTGIVATGSPEWYAEYRRRVAAVMDTGGQSATSHLYWIGLPPMREQPRQNLAAGINQILSEEAANRPRVTFVDIAGLLSGPDGGFSTHISDQEGHQRVARAPDGVHITLTGSSWVAERIWAAIGQRWMFVEGLIPPSGPPPPPASPPDLGPAAR